MREFADEPDEGLVAILVGTNRRVSAARDSVAGRQLASTNQLIAGFNKKLRDNKLTKLFDEMDNETQRRVSRRCKSLVHKKQL